MANLKYEIKLPHDVDEILDQDFFLFENLSGLMMQSMLEPIKFASSVSIFVKSGSVRASINLATYTLQAPCVVNIRASQILQKEFVSDDFCASFIVMSKRLTDSVMVMLNDQQLMARIAQQPVVEIKPEDVHLFENFYSNLKDISSDKSNPNMYQLLVHTIVAFYYRIASRYFPQETNGNNLSQSHLCQNFLTLAQANFREKRFLEFYAEQLEVSTKHLSRTLKRVTGYTASEWIERYVLLEAKVLLKSSNMSIQQIADELNFPTQSFFGKYFRNGVGVSPREFRLGKGK